MERTEKLFVERGHRFNSFPYNIMLFVEKKNNNYSIFRFNWARFRQVILYSIQGIPLFSLVQKFGRL